MQSNKVVKIFPHITTQTNFRTTTISRNKDNTNKLNHSYNLNRKPKQQTLTKTTTQHSWLSRLKTASPNFKIANHILGSLNFERLEIGEGTGSYLKFLA